MTNKPNATSADTPEQLNLFPEDGRVCDEDGYLDSRLEARVRRIVAENYCRLTLDKGEEVATLNCPEGVLQDITTLIQTVKTAKAQCLACYNMTPNVVYVTEEFAIKSWGAAGGVTSDCKGVYSQDKLDAQVARSAVRTALYLMGVDLYVIDQPGQFIQFSFAPPSRQGADFPFLTGVRFNVRAS